MPDAPKYKAKSLVSNKGPKSYGKWSWVRLGLVLLLGLGVTGIQVYQNRQKQFSAFEAGQRNAEFAASIEQPDRAISAWEKAVDSMEDIKQGHPKYDDAQAEIAKYEEEIKTARAEVSARRQAERIAASANTKKMAEAYEVFIRQIDPNRLSVADVRLDPDIENQIIVFVGPNWGRASKTERLDVAQTLWKGWGIVCACSTPRIKFRSQAGRDLGGTGVFGTAIELKD